MNTPHPPRRPANIWDLKPEDSPSNSQSDPATYAAGAWFEEIPVAAGSSSTVDPPAAVEHAAVPDEFMVSPPVSPSMSDALAPGGVPSAPLRSARNISTTTNVPSTLSYSAQNTSTSTALPSASSHLAQQSSTSTKLSNTPSHPAQNISTSSNVPNASSHSNQQTYTSTTLPSTLTHSISKITASAKLPSTPSHSNQQSSTSTKLPSSSVYSAQRTSTSTNISGTPSRQAQKTPTPSTKLPSSSTHSSQKSPAATTILVQHPSTHYASEHVRPSRISRFSDAFSAKSTSIPTIDMYESTEEMSDLESADHEHRRGRERKRSGGDYDRRHEDGGAARRNTNSTGSSKRFTDDDAAGAGKGRAEKPAAPKVLDKGKGKENTDRENNGMKAEAVEDAVPALSDIQEQKHIEGRGVWAMKPKKRKPAPATEETPAAADEDSDNPYANRKRKRKSGPHGSPTRLIRIRSETPDDIELSRQNVYDLEDIGKAIKDFHELVARVGVRNLRHHDFEKIRSALHLAPFKKVNRRHRNKVTSPLQTLMHDGDLYGIPHDIVSDSKHILERWLSDDLSPDILRGIDKTMHATAAGNNKTKITSSLEKNYPFKKEAGVPLHNGLENGQWWPRQICAVRDGAHGASEGGIFGDRKAAVSVILSGGSKDPKLAYEDEDDLHTVYYCGTRGNKDPNNPSQGIPSANTKLMMQAVDIKRPVRLLRSSKSKRKGTENYAPVEGIRYDGLYDVVSYEYLSREYAMLRFKLVRCPGQPPVRWRGDTIKPDNHELEAWEDSKDLYRVPNDW